jgi:uncharacterized protein
MSGAGGMRHLTPADYHRTPWKNGGGVSLTIAGERLPGHLPGDWPGVVWQLGRTAIVAPGPFSDLSGFERLQTVVSGRGLWLDTPRETIDLSLPLTVARYDGGTPIISRLAAGPVEVVNLIARRDLVRIAMEVLRGGDARGLADGMHVIYACAGPVDLAVDGMAVAIDDGHAAVQDGTCHVQVTRGVALLASAAPVRPVRGPSEEP